MKIAIQGHKTRGKEVIQILESLGGRNCFSDMGFNKGRYYYINPYNIIIDSTPTIVIKEGYKLYTLEEFKTQFPFKIGDKVVVKGCHTPHEIIALEPLNKTLCYKASNGFHYRPEYLELYKEMEEMEERNITLTLDKAREWYKKGGELKEIALQAFKELELNPLPRSWEEFAANNARMGYYISADGKPLMCASSGKLSSPHVCPSKESAEAHLAMIQLEQLRNCWRQGWTQTSLNTGYRIGKTLTGDYIVTPVLSFKYFLTFPTEEMAEEFLKCFRDLIEKAGDLI